MGQLINRREFLKKMGYVATAVIVTESVADSTVALIETPPAFRNYALPDTRNVVWLVEMQLFGIAIDKSQLGVFQLRRAGVAGGVMFDHSINAFGGALLWRPHPEAVICIPKEFPIEITASEDVQWGLHVACGDRHALICGQGNSSGQNTRFDMLYKAIAAERGIDQQITYQEL